MGVAYGVTMMIFGSGIGAENVLWTFLFNMIFFGGLMSIILVSLHRRRLGAKGIKQFTSDNLKVHQEKIVISNLNQKAFLERLKSDSKLGKMKLEEQENSIVIKIGMSMESWGEKIRIMINPLVNDEYEYHISSTPILKTTLVDFGKNLQNVNYIEKLFTD